MRMQTCCENGCSLCRGDRYQINPTWKKYRKDPVKNNELFQCSICLTDVEVNGNKFVLNCRHEFHPDCIFRWMRESRKCPVCRKYDIYLQGEKFPLSEEESIFYSQADRYAAPEPLRICLLYTSPSPRDQRGSRMPSSA